MFESHHSRTVWSKISSSKKFEHLFTLFCSFSSMNSAVMDFNYGLLMFLILLVNSFD